MNKIYSAPYLTKTCICFATSSIFSHTIRNYYSAAEIGSRIIKALGDKVTNVDPHFNNYINRYTFPYYRSCYETIKDTSPDLSEDEFIKNIYAYTVFSNYRRHLRLGKTANDPGTILDKADLI